MHINQYLQDLETLKQTNDVTNSNIGQELQTIYGEDQSILHGQIQRYIKLLAMYKTLYGEQDVLLVRAPGRVDLMGSHTDYHQGYVFPMALDKDTLIVAGKRHDKNIILNNTNKDFSAQEFTLEQEILRSEKGSWENYVKASAQAFIRDYGLEHISGMNAVIDGCPPYCVPLAAGLSSSSALLIAAAVALAELNEISMEIKQFARFCGEAEWYVGTRGGFMDHFTSILNQKGHALFLDCRPVVMSGKETFITENIPLPEGYEVAVCNTNVKKEKSASSEYNTRVLETKIGLELLKAHFPSAECLRDIPIDTRLDGLLPAKVTPEGLRQLFPPEKYEDILQTAGVTEFSELKILSRCQHVLTENARVLKGRELLKMGNIAAFGALMTESYISIRDDFEGSCPELNQLIESVLRFQGTLGARIAGAGWGGCAVALVESSKASEFRTHITEEYYQKTGIQAEIFLCYPGQGAGTL